MINTRLVTAASGLVAATGIVIGAAALSGASTPAASTTAYSVAGAESAPGRGGSNDTPVTGPALSKVTAAVKAKDPAEGDHARRDPSSQASGPPDGPRAGISRAWTS